MGHTVPRFGATSASVAKRPCFCGRGQDLLPGAAVKTEKDIAEVAFDRVVSEMQPETRVTAEKKTALTDAMRTNFVSGDMQFRRIYIRAVVYEVEVYDIEIRIHGQRTVLERLVIGGGATQAGMPSFVRMWRALRDSNS
jgi:site-specific DNA recombinase